MQQPGPVRGVLVERVVADALAHHGTSSRPRARALGLRDDEITRLLRAGVWGELHRSALWVCPQPEGPSLLTRAAAARWAAGEGLRPRGVCCGRTAGALWGLPVAADGPTEITVVGAHRASTAALRHRQLALRPEEVTWIRGLAVTTVLRTVADLAHGASYADVLAVLDSAARHGLIPADAVILEGVLPTRLHRAAHEADGRAESPFESRVRAELLLAGLPPPIPQYVIHDAGGAFVARVDLAWPRQRLVVEADGASVHASPQALRADLRRQNAIVAAGYRLLRFTWADLGRIAPPVASALSPRPC